MIFKTYQFSLLLRAIFMFASAFGIAFVWMRGWHTLGVVWILVAAYQLYDLYTLMKRAQEEINDFAQSVHYRDFTRHFNVRQAPAELQPLRQGFNEINTTFKEIRNEKEMQFQYLQMILELVDTGILSYNTSNHNLNWLNETFKRMLDIPYLRTIESLQKRYPLLYEEVLRIQPGDSKVVSVEKDGQPLNMIMAATVFQTEGAVNKIIAFQNVNDALDETEAKAWQKLLSVMTHEIMNSVAPISSLADTLKNRLTQAVDSKDYSDETWEDIELGLETIKRRSEGLLKFAESYRSLNKITSLILQRIPVSSLFENLNTLMAPTLEQKNVQLETILKDPQLSLSADPSLVEQVLINLLVNALEAVKSVPHPKISLSAYASADGKITLRVADNGTGIQDEVLDKIFVPFFTTRKNGSGIGLSLCKQIMMLHRGNIFVRSIPGSGAEFLLVFPSRPAEVEGVG